GARSRTLFEIIPFNHRERSPPVSAIRARPLRSCIPQEERRARNSARTSPKSGDWPCVDPSCKAVFTSSTSIITEDRAAGEESLRPLWRRDHALVRPRWNPISMYRRVILISSFRVSEKRRIAVIPGDGIGKEVIPQAVRVLEAVGSDFAVTHFD